MADSYLGYQNPSTADKKLDSESLIVGANTVERERIQIAGSGATQIAPVHETNGLAVDPKTLPPGAATSAKQDTIIGYIDGIESSVAQIEGYLDSVESLLTTIDSHVDGLEGKDYATSAKQDILIGHVDGIEGSIDQIEGYLDGVEALLTTIDADTSVIADAVKASTATVTSVNDTASSTTLLAANANRKGATIYNDSTVALYIKFGVTASATDFTVKLSPNNYYEVPNGYTGRIDGIWASDASGAARITELT